MFVYAYLVQSLVKQGLLGYGNVQAGVQRIRAHLSVVAVVNSKQPVWLIEVRPLHLAFHVVCCNCFRRQNCQFHGRFRRQSCQFHGRVCTLEKSPPLQNRAVEGTGLIGGERKRQEMVEESYEYVWFIWRDQYQNRSSLLF